MKTNRPVIDIVGPVLVFVAAILFLLLYLDSPVLSTFIPKYVWCGIWGVWALQFLVSIFTKVLYPPLMVKNNILYIALDRNVIPKKIPLENIDHVERHSIDLTNPNWHPGKFYSEYFYIMRKHGKKYRVNFGRINEKQYNEINGFIKNALAGIKINEVFSK